MQTPPFMIPASSPFIHDRAPALSLHAPDADPLSFQPTLACVMARTTAVLFLLLALAVAPARAQVPETLPYQALLTDTDGVPVDDPGATLTFRLYDSPGGGTVRWTETHTGVPITGGVLSVQLGSVEALDAVAFDEPLYLAVALGDVGAEELAPRAVLGSAPYALQARGVRVSGSVDSPNVVLGFAGNRVAEGIVGSTIGGGGQEEEWNAVNGDHGTVGGGRANEALSRETTVGGGRSNKALGEGATVGGGFNNEAGDIQATVSGGQNNEAGGVASTVAGGGSNKTFEEGSTVGGGASNAASGIASTVAGGAFNRVEAPFGTIAGGGADTEEEGNRVTDEWGSVGGGSQNQAGDDAGTTDNARYATVSGSRDNVASGGQSTVGGGSGNEAIESGSTVGGGWDNIAMGDQSTVAGGDNNDALGLRSTVGGGRDNEASGDYATVPGGRDNQAGADYSLAAGQRAIIESTHSGSFLFADGANHDFSSTAANEFSVRAHGGARFVTSVSPDGSPFSGVILPPGGGSWETLSDRTKKEHFAPVDARAVLQGVVSLPLATWSYKAQSSSGVRHLGPMAQDFYGAFGLGSDARRIATVDADGVALAAIQGLYQLVDEQRHEIDEQHREIEYLRALVERLLGEAPSFSMTGAGDHEDAHRL